MASVASLAHSFLGSANILQLSKHECTHFWVGAITTIAIMITVTVTVKTNRFCETKQYRRENRARSEAYRLTPLDAAATHESSCINTSHVR